MLADPGKPTTLGADLRALRRARGITLEHLARSIGKSVGWISQVERDLSDPSLEDLQAIATQFDVPLSLFFASTNGAPADQGHVVRASARRQIGSADGLAESLLSPDLTDDFEVLHATFAPGASRPDNVCRPTQELGYLVSGTLDIWINDTPFTVRAGDSFRVRAEPYRWSNPYPDPAVAIWVIAPPVY